MRIFLALAVLLASLSARADYYDYVYFRCHNTGTGNLWVRYSEPQNQPEESNLGGVSGGNTLSGSGTRLTSGSEPWVHTVKWYSDADCTVCVQTDTVTKMHDSSSMISDIYCDGLGAPTTTNRCVYHVRWWNNGKTSAHMRAIIVYGNGTMVDGLGGPAYVGPGRLFDQWFTNASPAGGCGEMLVGDSSEGATAPEGHFPGYEIGVPVPGAPGHGSGSGDGSGDPVPGPGQTNQPPGGTYPPPGTSTNSGPTQADAYAIGDGIVDAVSGVERAVRDGNRKLDMIGGILATNGNGSGSGDGTNVSVMNWPTNSTEVRGKLADMLDGGTNGASALARASSALGDVSGGQDTIKGWTDVNRTTIPESAGTADMTFEFCGETVDLDPVHMFPAAVNICFAGLSFIALAFFFWDVSKLFRECLFMYSAVNTAGVPVMSAEVLGFGGNVLGVMVALVVPAVLIGIWVTALLAGYSFLTAAVTGQQANILACATRINSYLGDFQGSGGLSSSTGKGIGWYLLASFVPVNLLISCVLTRVTLAFTMMKATGLAVTASKYLFGH